MIIPDNFSKSSLRHFVKVASRGECVTEFHVCAYMKMKV